MHALLSNTNLETILSGTDRLEAVVEDVYSHFLNRYLPGEIIHCKWDDGIMYVERQSGHYILGISMPI